jgi:hypothetical protein
LKGRNTTIAFIGAKKGRGISFQSDTFDNQYFTSAKRQSVTHPARGGPFWTGHLPAKIVAVLPLPLSKKWKGNCVTSGDTI